MGEKVSRILLQADTCLGALQDFGLHVSTASILSAIAGPLALLKWGSLISWTPSGSVPARCEGLHYICLCNYAKINTTVDTA